jgi:methylthioribose-1-phosphate isomerase
VVGQVRGPRLRTGVRVANIAFDSTPVVWFDGIFTEQGRLTESLLARTRRAVTAGAKLLMVRG